MKYRTVIIKEDILMSHVYWEKKEIPIPENAYINHNDGRVFIYLNGGRKVIGHATSETTMHPNDSFRTVFPDLWKDNYGAKDTLPFELHAGLYMLTLGAALTNGIYSILVDVYEPMYANAIMDYVMYSLHAKSDVTQAFSEFAQDQILFSRKYYSDSWYSDLFRSQMTSQLEGDFKVRWLKHCQDLGITRAWIAIDGSNNDCEVQESDLCEYGKAKSHNDCTIVSYIYALDTRTGMPITYFVNEGSVVDSKAFQKVLTFFNGYHIEIEGVLIDRGFCTHDVVTACMESRIDYIMMVPSDTYGHQKIMDECSELIRWEPEMIVNDDGIFGITRQEQLFWQHPEKAYLNLYFNGSSSSIQSIRLIRGIRQEGAKAEKAAAAGRTPSVAKEYRKYIKTEKQEDGSYKVSYDFSTWKSAMRSKGYFSLASDRNHSPQEAYDLYRLRDVSEIQYGILKSQEGFDTTRVHFTSSIYAKFLVCFAASCIRSSIASACSDLQLSANDMIQKMDRVHFILGEGGSYLAVKDLSKDAELLLLKFGLSKEQLSDVASDYNQRMSPICSQVRSLPKQEPKPKKKRGRKPGSKNRKTLEREAQGEIKVSHGKAGRPKGSKDTKPRKSRSDKGKKRTKVSDKASS